MGMVVLMDNLWPVWALIAWFAAVLGLQTWRIRRLKRTIRKQREELDNARAISEPTGRNGVEHGPVDHSP